MQGIDKIIEKIIADAEADAKQTAKQTEKQIDDLRKRHDKQTQELVDELNKEFAEKRAQLKSRAKTMADLETRRNKLAIKRELVEEAFNKAQEDMKSLSDEEYLSFIEKMMRNLEDKRGEIIIGKNEKKITDSFIDEINKKTDSAYKLAKDKGNFEGGFILRNGKVDTNCTLNMMVSLSKRNLEQKVAAVLFDESGV